jgi:hypothetical protein
MKVVFTTAIRRLILEHNMSEPIEERLKELTDEELRERYCTRKRDHNSISGNVMGSEKFISMIFNESLDAAAEAREKASNGVEPEYTGDLVKDFPADMTHITGFCLSYISLRRTEEEMLTRGLSY